LERLHRTWEERGTARGITWKPEKEKIKVCGPEKQQYANLVQTKLAIKCMQVEKMHHNNVKVLWVVAKDCNMVAKEY